MVTIQLLVRVTIDMPTEEMAKSWVVDTLEKNLFESEESVDVLDQSDQVLVD